MCSGAAHKILNWVVFHVKHNQYDFQEFLAFYTLVFQFTTTIS